MCANQIDWPGLLKWSLTFTRGDDETASAEPRSTEDMEFLQAAMTEFRSNQPDANKMVEEALIQLEEVSRSTPDYLAALSMIVEASDLEPELARYLNKFDGLLECLQKLLVHPSIPVREKVAELLALCLPNNLEIQCLMHSMGLLDQLMTALITNREYAFSSREGDQRYFTKLMSVLNALVKNAPVVEQDFLEKYNGREFVENLRSTPIDRLKVKVESMLEHLDNLSRPVDVISPIKAPLQLTN